MGENDTKPPETSGLELDLSSRQPPPSSPSTSGPRSAAKTSNPHMLAARSASRLGAGTKMHHFSYVGDASVGKNVNIGAGTITLNYDGVHKNRTEIGDDAFIGSDTLLRAPVKVGRGATTGAGAVVTKDVPEDTVAVGMPARAIKKYVRPRKDAGQKPAS